MRSPGSPGSEGYTDDLSLTVQAGRSVKNLVDHVLRSTEQGRQHERIVAELREQFGLSVEDAELAIDRVCGGTTRALTGNRAYCPDRKKDPIAWISFQRAITKR